MTDLTARLRGWARVRTTINGQPHPTMLPADLLESAAAALDAKDAEIQQLRETRRVLIDAYKGWAKRALDAEAALSRSDTPGEQ